MKSRKSIALCLMLTCVVSFVVQLKGQELQKQMWTGKLKLNDSIQLVFNFEMHNNAAGTPLTIYNADERIAVTDIVETSDSLNFKMPLYDSEFKCKKKKDELSGVWINHARKSNNVLTFIAYKSIILFPPTDHPSFNGKWEVTFNPGTKNEYKGIGLFEHLNNNSKQLAGTVLTETGDFRYLSGVSPNDSTLYLASFDGTHALVFKAKQKSDKHLEGYLYAGTHGYEKWTAVRNDAFELRNPDSLTYLKSGFDQLQFSFPNLSGKKVSLADAKYKNKVVIVQLMGSWCPNCIDETKFLSEFYKKNKSKGLEVIALAYERGDDTAKAIANIVRLQKKFDFNYEVLIASTSSDRNEAVKTLPMLNHIMSFPTTIFVDKKGRVRKIYTGFNGPATGKYYEKYVDDTNNFISKLLVE